jgi:hypothetical protein
MHFGAPVVPEENIVNRGWLNGWRGQSGRSSPPTAIAEQIGKPVQAHRPLAGGKRAVVQRDDRGEAGQAGRCASDALGDGRARIPWLRPEAAEQHDGLQGGEAREDGGHAHVRRAASEGRANGSGGQGGNDRLGIVACDRCDMVARAHTQRLQ